MNLLPYFEVFLSFLLAEYLEGFWIAGIGFTAIFFVLKLLTKKRYFHV